MKFRGAIIVGVILIFSGLMVISPAIAAPNENANDRAKSGPAVSIPENAVQISDHVYYLGKSKDVDGKAVEGFMFVHPKNEPAKPDKPDKPDKPGKGGGGKKGGGGPSCFAFIAKGAKWKSTEDYVLDTSNEDGLPEGIVANTISTSLETWDGEVGFEIFGTRDTGETVDEVDTSSPDGLNEVLFGVIDEPNVIASTIVWRTVGPPQVREFVEWDMIFDDPDFTWGVANGDTDIMDLQNIATHEIGHAAGMTHPDNSCTEETMYAFATEGEIIKRDLNSGDMAGINQLYP